MSARGAQLPCLFLLVFLASVLPAADSRYTVKEGETLFSVARRAQVPVDVLSGYIEAKYKITSQYWAALRVNQSWFGNIPGQTTSWDRNTSRVDLGLGYRYSTHIGAKVQYSYAQQQGPDTEGNHLFAAQVIVRF